MLLLSCNLLFLFYLLLWYLFNYFRTKTINRIFIILQHKYNILSHSVKTLDHIRISNPKIIPCFLIINIIKQIINVIDFLDNILELLNKYLEFRVDCNKSVLPYDSMSGSDCGVTWREVVRIWHVSILWMHHYWMLGICLLWQWIRGRVDHVARIYWSVLRWMRVVGLGLMIVYIGNILYRMNICHQRMLMMILIFDNINIILHCVHVIFQLMPIYMSL